MAPAPIAMPAPASASGQTRESARPTPRSARIADQTSRTVPAIRRRAAGSAAPGAGSSAQMPTYATIPAPLANARNANVSRTSVGVDCKRIADPGGDARDDSVALCALDARERDRQAKGADAAQPRSTVRRPSPDVRVEHEHPRPDRFRCRARACARKSRRRPDRRRRHLRHRRARRLRRRPRAGRPPGDSRCRASPSRLSGPLRVPGRRGRR